MSYTHIHQSIRKALEEGCHAYSSMLEAGETPNMDYAGYCSHVALGRLRKALNNPLSVLTDWKECCAVWPANMRVNILNPDGQMSRRATCAAM
ncbi:MAG: hypothetical protein AUJ12_04675 [Alphaproteobacteria bacterium CG1_02_46_17]|nr:MAG: hypothetical protein AUJ12_04675 [Alphaproteobacteria bacterium CG1_02_46_17]